MGMRGFRRAQYSLAERHTNLSESGHELEMIVVTSREYPRLDHNRAWSLRSYEVSVVGEA